MPPRTAELSPQVYARVAGLLYLLPFEAFSLQYVPLRLIVPGDATATANNILANESLFRLGIVSHLIGQVVLILVVLLLYQLLKPVNKNMAVLMVIFNLVSVPLVMLNELNQFAILFLVHNPAGLPADQMHTLVSLFLNLHASGLNIVEIFWGLWLFPMGYLVFRSGFLPRIIGILLIIGCVGYLIQFAVDLLFPSVSVNIYVFTSLGEALFPLWLLIRGVNVAQWEKHTRALTS
jgi:hypothetical protein